MNNVGYSRNELKFLALSCLEKKRNLKTGLVKNDIFQKTATVEKIINMPVPNEN